MRSILLYGLLAVLGAAAGGVAPEQGRLCLDAREEKPGDARCAESTGLLLDIEAVDHERHFLWTSSDQKSVRLGVVPAKAGSIALDGPALKEVRVRIRSEGGAGVWPVDTTITLTGKESWTWTIPAKAVDRLARLFLPQDRYAVRIDAGHHRVWRSTLEVKEKTQDAGELRLLPLPLASGLVVDSEGNPIGGASIALEDGEPCAIANEQGAFECEIPEKKRIEAILVGAPGFASCELVLSRVPNLGFQLGRVALTKAHPLVVKIVRPEAERPAGVTLFYDAPHRHELSKIATREVTEREQELTFENTGTGTYLVVVEGREPLEKLEVPVEVKEGEEARKTIIIEPFLLQGSVRFGDAPPADGTPIQILSPRDAWRERMTIAGGTFGGPMWQHGRVLAFVHVSEATGSELLHSPELGDDPSQWKVEIRKRLIAGRIIDAETRQPLSEAGLDLVAEFASGRSYATQKVNGDGSYQVLANQPGTYTLRAAARDHVPVEIDVKIAEADGGKTLDIALERGVVQVLEIVTPDHKPIPDALIVEGVQPDRVNPRRSFVAGPDGRFELRGKPGEARLLYVVPPSGSLAVVRVTIPQSSERAKPFQVVVPGPSSSLRVRVVDEDGKPLSRWILLRYNGEFVPYAIGRFVSGDGYGMDGSGQALLQRLPAGAYEVWALTSRAEEEVLMANGGSSSAPVRVGLSGGEAAVTLTVPERESPRRPAPLK